MTEDIFNCTIHFLNANDYVDVDITFDELFYYGYGYGYGEGDSYFDVFDITGDFYGYGSGTFESDYSGIYGYGYGYETSQFFVLQSDRLDIAVADRKDNVRTRDVVYANIQVTPAGEYDIILYSKYPGNIIYGYMIDTYTYSIDPVVSFDSDYRPCFKARTNASGYLKIGVNSPFNFDYPSNFSPTWERCFDLRVCVKNKIIQPKTYSVKGKIRKDFVSTDLLVSSYGYIQYWS